MEERVRSIAMALARIPEAYAAKLRGTCDHVRSKVPARWDTLDPVGEYRDEIERVEMRNCPTCGSTLAIAFALLLGACGVASEVEPLSTIDAGAGVDAAVDARPDRKVAPPLFTPDANPGSLRGRR
jgi:hypothetical protein